jgi:hypothetical protein
MKLFNVHIAMAQGTGWAVFRSASSYRHLGDCSTGMWTISVGQPSDLIKLISLKFTAPPPPFTNAGTQSAFRAKRSVI